MSTTTRTSKTKRTQSDLTKEANIRRGIEADSRIREAHQAGEWPPVRAAMCGVFRELLTMTAEQKAKGGYTPGELAERLRLSDTETRKCLCELPGAIAVHVRDRIDLVRKRITNGARYSLAYRCPCDTCQGTGLREDGGQ